MLDGLSLPFICAANPRSFAQWFACLKQLMLHPLLNEEEKFLWLWLATQSTDNKSLNCSLSYEQISQLTNRSCKKVHRHLTRLRTMGFLIADIPIHYGELILEMTQQIRNIQLMIPPMSLRMPVYSSLPIKHIAASHRLPQIWGEIPIRNNYA